MDGMGLGGWKMCRSVPFRKPPPPYLFGKVLVFIGMSEGCLSNALISLRLKSKPSESKRYGPTAVGQTVAGGSLGRFGLLVCDLAID
jgi:hypothetical protein